jgi:hypothetical protein
MEIVKTTLSGVSTLVAKRVPFDCNGTLRGTVIDKGSYQMERLVTEFRRYRRDPDNERNPFGKLALRFGAELINSLIDSQKVFVIYSYETPIAWTDKDGGWIIPDVSYSATTSKHIGKCGIRSQATLLP